jgi:hypothetical protein
MQERFPNIIGNRPPVIRKVDLGGRGTFYRVRIPTGSRDEARNICAQLKAAGGECFVGPADSG